MLLLLLAAILRTWSRPREQLSLLLPASVAKKGMQTMSVTQPLSSFKRAGLLMRDAASLLCGTLLFEFELEQAKSLRKRLRLVMDVLPSVELELSRFGAAEWPRLRRDLETLLEACETFQRDPPPSMPCDRYEELGDPKRRVHADLTSLKIAITRIVKTAEAQTAAREARVAVEAQTVMDEASPVASAQATLNATPAQDQGSEPTRQPLVAPPPVAEKNSGAQELATTVAAGPSTDPERTEVSEADAVAVFEGKKKGKKKKKKAKPVLITERPTYPIWQEEQPIFEALGRLAQAGVPEAHLKKLLAAAEELFHPPTSLGLQLELASRLFSAASETFRATSTAERPVEQLLAACTKAGEIYADCLQQHPEDAFVRWDLTQCLFWRASEAMSESPVFKDTVTEAIHHLRYFHLHGHNFGPLFNHDPLHFASLLCYLLALFASASLIKSEDQPLALRTFEEVLALSSTPLPKQGDGIAMGLARCEAAEYVATAYLAEENTKGALATALSGIKTALSLDEGEEVSLAREWYVKLVEVAKRVCRADEKRLVKIHSIRKTQAQARKILGQPDSEAQKTELKSLTRARDGARKVLRDLDNMLGG